MELSTKTTIGKLLDRYPFLLDFLVGKSPRFSKLKNPLLRKTMAKVASISHAAGMGGLDEDRLLLEIAGEIFAKTNDSITLVNPGGRAEIPRAATREERARILKDIVVRLHRGAGLDEVREEFRELLADVSPAEIGAMEQELVADGIPESEIKRLCELHVELFTSTMEAPELPEFLPGHPIRTMQEENRLAESKARALQEAAEAAADPLAFSAARPGLAEGVRDLSNVVRHYERKENQLFPIMEEHGLTAPPQVMWAIHDDIRALLKQSAAAVEAGDAAAVEAVVKELAVTVRDMVHKEEKILFPMVHESFTDKDWARVRLGEEEIGHAWIEPGDQWRPVELETGTAAGEAVRLDAGELKPATINALLKTLPVELSFVGADDRVAYFSQTEERIFPRSAGVIGRKVAMCHPKKSLHMVEEIVSKFKSGERDSAEFWIEHGGRFIHIRFFAVRQDDGAYEGVLEVVQDVTGIRALTGQKRLLDWT